MENINLELIIYMCTTMGIVHNTLWDSTLHTRNVT
jgi:hypothetical protein